MCRASLCSRNLGTFLLGQLPSLSSDSSGMAGWVADSPRSGRDRWSCLHTTQSHCEVQLCRCHVRVWRELRQRPGLEEREGPIWAAGLWAPAGAGVAAGGCEQALSPVRPLPCPEPRDPRSAVHRDRETPTGSSRGDATRQAAQKNPVGTATLYSFSPPNG